MTAEYKISVIIPCFNADKFLAETVESVFRQTFRNYEIILVDDGSTDNTPLVIRSFGSKVRAEFRPHQGASQARNYGTSLAQGDFIQYLDADDLLSPNALEKRGDALVNANADVAYSDWQELNEMKGGVFQPGEIVSRKIEDVNLDPEIALFTDFWAPPAAYLFRKSMIEKINGWNESLPIIQDARFALDCALRGASFIYCPGVTAYYRKHSSQSLSRQDSMAFLKDCFHNALQVQGCWGSHGGITAERKKALLQVYQQVARGAYRKDMTVFETAYAELRRLEPKYLPKTPKQLALVSKIFGYRKAEEIAYQFRKIKKLLNLKSG